MPRVRDDELRVRGALRGVVSATVVREGECLRKDAGGDGGGLVVLGVNSCGGEVGLQRGEGARALHGDVGGGEGLEDWAVARGCSGIGKRREHGKG